MSQTTKKTKYMSLALSNRVILWTKKWYFVLNGFVDNVTFVGLLDIRILEGNLRCFQEAKHSIISELSKNINIMFQLSDDHVRTRTGKIC